MLWEYKNWHNSFVIRERSLHRGLPDQTWRYPWPPKPDVVRKARYVKACCIEGYLYTSYCLAFKHDRPASIAAQLYFLKWTKLCVVLLPVPGAVVLSDNLPRPLHSNTGIRLAWRSIFVPVFLLKPMYVYIQWYSDIYTYSEAFSEIELNVFLDTLILQIYFLIPKKVISAVT